jgi:CheY-like chemotaxis protein
MSQVLIALVDDDEPVRDATKTLVRSLGYHASRFGSADEFLKSKQVHDTSCLITDVQMRGLSGIDLQDHLVGRGPALASPDGSHVPREASLEAKKTDESRNGLGGRWVVVANGWRIGRKR